MNWTVLKSCRKFHWNHWSFDSFLIPLGIVFDISNLVTPADHLHKMFVTYLQTIFNVIVHPAPSKVNLWYFPHPNYLWSLKRPSIEECSQISIYIIAWCIEVLHLTFISRFAWCRVTSSFTHAWPPIQAPGWSDYCAKVGFNRIINPKQGMTSINNISKWKDLFID